MAMRLSMIARIFRREMRDQLRDSRTLGVIFLAPILLYPTLAFAVTRLAPTLRPKGPWRIGVVGASKLPAEPPLLAPDRATFHPSLFAAAPVAAGLAVEANDDLLPAAVRERRLPVLVVLPADLGAPGGPKQITLHFDSTNEMSSVLQGALREVFDAWKAKLIAHKLQTAGLSAEWAAPFTVAAAHASDVATAADRSRSVWARMLPFVIVMLLLTGAFYPSVDLCAGEKERGTMETLLVSPALRIEIVLGKFATIWAFSVAATAFNLVSLSLSMMYVTANLPMLGGGIELPSLATVVAAAAVMAPLSAFLSAWCMALAVFARSAREGQYYLTPLFLIATPLVFLTAAPGVELNFVTSLIPIANASLLLRELIAGDFRTAGTYLPLVLAPTALYAALALRWAVEQFEREDVLFRAADGPKPKAWMRWLLRPKEPTPDAGEAFFFFVLIFGLCSFGWATPGVKGLWSTTVGALAFVVAPAVLWALLLTANPRRTLGLRLPAGRDVGFGVGLGLLAFPAAAALFAALRRTYATPSDFPGLLEPTATGEPLWIAYFVLAVVRPAANELAFRGLILQGLLRRYPATLAVGVAAMLAGVLPLVPWQAPLYATLALVQGMLAVRTRSILPGIAFSMTLSALLLPYSHPHTLGAAPPEWDFAPAVASVLASVLALLAFTRRRAGGVSPLSSFTQK